MAKQKIPDSVEGLTKYLNSLTEDNFQVYGNKFADMVLGFSSSEARAQAAVELVFETTVESKETAELGARVCERVVLGGSNPQSKAKESEQFRKLLLGSFQKEFLRRAETRKRSIEAWLAVFSFLCEVYVRVKVSNEPVKVVGGAILSSAQFLLELPDVDDDEVDCVCSCLKLCGRFLESQKKTELDKVVCLLRSKVISSGSRCRVRCVVLELLEYRLMGWSDRGGELALYYSDAVADAIAEDELEGDLS